MSVSLKDDRYVNIDEYSFTQMRGVSEARDQSTGEDVIIKGFLILSPKQANEARQEAEVLKRLDHANIVKFIDFLDEEQPEWASSTFSFIIMENCSGGSLVDWVERRKKDNRSTSPDEAALIGAQLVSALSFCHERNQIHLDLKPANIFILADDITIKIGDFGSAATVMSVALTHTAESSDPVAFTRLYAIPEVFTEDDYSKSPRMDVWGFGLILQEVITLEHAFGRDKRDPTKSGHAISNPLAIINNMMNGVRSLISDVLDNYAEFEKFEPVLEKCLSPKKINRPKNMILLRKEPVFTNFLTKLENGEKPTDIMVHSEVERLRLQNSDKDKKIEELEEKVRSLQEQLKEIQQNIESKSESEDESQPQSDENAPEDEETQSPFIQNERDSINHLGSIDGAGHFFQNDKATVRSEMKEKELNNIITLLESGAREINVKFSCEDEWKITCSGWQLQFNTVMSTGDLPEDSWYLFWVGKKDNPMPFKVIAQEICYETGREENHKVIKSDGKKVPIRYKSTTDFYFIRFNISFLE